MCWLSNLKSTGSIYSHRVRNRKIFFVFFYLFHCLEFVFCPETCIGGEFEGPWMIANMRGDCFDVDKGFFRSVARIQLHLYRYTSFHQGL